PVGDEVVLPGFVDSPIRLRIDPALDAAVNAALRYDRARRRLARAERAETLLPELEARAEELGRNLAAVPDADLKRLRELEAWLLEAEGTGTGNPKRSTGASSRHQQTL